MTSHEDDWSHITDICERRKAQNRIAQRNYRSRQRMRIELAEAILFDLPHKTQRWQDNRSNSRSNTRSRSPDFDSSSFHPDALEFLDVSAFDPDGPSHALANVDEAFDIQTQDKLDSGPRQTSWATKRPPALEASQAQHIHTSDVQAPPLDPCSPSNAFDCLDDFSNPQESNNVSTATSTTESISPPPSLSQSTRSTTAVSSRSSCPSNPDAAAESTPLLTAVMRGNVEIARLLINNGGNVDCKKAGKTALHMAVERGDTVASRTLLDLGADITLADDEGMTVFHKAVGRDDSEQLRALLKWAEEKSKTPSSEGLLQKCLNAKDKLNRSLVHMAVLLERMTILRMLLEYGADVNE